MFMSPSLHPFSTCGEGESLALLLPRQARETTLAGTGRQLTVVAAVSSSATLTAKHFCGGCSYSIIYLAEPVVFGCRYQFSVHGHINEVSPLAQYNIEQKT